MTLLKAGIPVELDADVSGALADGAAGGGAAPPDAGPGAPGGDGGDGAWARPSLGAHQATSGRAPGEEGEGASCAWGAGFSGGDGGPPPGGPGAEGELWGSRGGVGGGASFDAGWAARREGSECDVGRSLALPAARDQGSRRWEAEATGAAVPGPSSSSAPPSRPGSALGREDSGGWVPAPGDGTATPAHFARSSSSLAAPGAATPAHFARSSSSLAVPGACCPSHPLPPRPPSRPASAPSRPGSGLGAPPPPPSASAPLADALSAVDPREWRVPPLCVPVLANVTTFPWSSLASRAQFDAVLLDPPWRLATANPTRGVALGYSQLEDRDVLAIPLGSLQPMHGLVFLYTINAKIAFSLACLAAWGYELVGEVAWTKLTVNRRLAKSHGFYLQHAKETCLVGRKIRDVDRRPGANPNGEEDSMEPERAATHRDASANQGEEDAMDADQATTTAADPMDAVQATMTTADLMDAVQATTTTADDVDAADADKENAAVPPPAAPAPSRIPFPAPEAVSRHLERVRGEAALAAARKTIHARRLAVERRRAMIRGEEQPGGGGGRDEADARSSSSNAPIVAGSASGAKMPMAAGATSAPKAPFATGSASGPNARPFSPACPAPPPSASAPPTPPLCLTPASDLLLAMRRGQSQKPEETYALIERLVPGKRYLEIFGRKNNLHDGWVTIGNEVTGQGRPEDDDRAVAEGKRAPGAVYGRNMRS